MENNFDKSKYTKRNYIIFYYYFKAGNTNK